MANTVVEQKKITPNKRQMKIDTMNETLFKSAYLELISEDNELYLRINGAFDVEIDRKQFIELLAIAQKAKEAGVNNE